MNIKKAQVCKPAFFDYTHQKMLVTSETHSGLMPLYEAIYKKGQKLLGDAG